MKFSFQEKVICGEAVSILTPAFDCVTLIYPAAALRLVKRAIGDPKRKSRRNRENIT